MNLRNFLTSLGTAILLSGCLMNQNPPPSTNAVPAPSVITHKVQYLGESLALISYWYTGQANNWKKIQEANQGLDPRRIRLGDEIKIPLEIVVKQEPLPRSLVESWSKKPAHGKQPEPAAQVEVEATPTATPELATASSSAAAVDLSEFLAGSRRAIVPTSAAVVKQTVKPTVAAPTPKIATPLPTEIPTPTSAPTLAVTPTTPAQSSSSAASPEATDGGKRVLTRDELLKELLKE